MSVIDYVVVNEDGTRIENASIRAELLLRGSDTWSAETYLEDDCVGHIEVKKHQLPQPETFAREVTYYPQVAYQGDRLPVRAVIPAVNGLPEVSFDDLSYWVLFHAVRPLDAREMAIFQATKNKVLKAFLQQAMDDGVENLILVNEVPEEMKSRIMAAMVAFDRFMLTMGWDKAPDSEQVFELAFMAWLEQLNDLEGLFSCQELEYYLHGSELKAQMMFVKRLMDAEDAAAGTEEADDEGSDELPEFLEVDVEDYSVEFRGCEFGDSCFVDPDMGVTPCEYVEPWSGSAWDEDGEKILDIEYCEAEGHEAQAKLRLIWPWMEQEFFVRSDGAENENLVRKLIEIENSSNSAFGEDIAFLRAMHRVWMEYMVMRVDDLQANGSPTDVYDFGEDCVGECEHCCDEGWKRMNLAMERLRMLDLISGVSGVTMDPDAFDLAREAWEEVLGLLRPGVNADYFSEAFELYCSLQLYAWVRFRDLIG